MIPDIILSSPSLLFLYYRIEQILGIISTPESLIKLNGYLEKCTGASFTEDPAAFECILSSREQIFEISKLLTISETYFFREGIHFDLLAKLLPKYSHLNRPIQICSAAASIGCEAYSISMLLEYYSKTMRINYEIDAFDISSEAIETAKSGRYTSNALRTDGSAWKYILDAYLIHDGGEFVVCEKIRKKVNFFNHNIMNGLDKKYDIIFLRNALIYFSSRNRFIVTDEIVKSLTDNGVLITGISETSSIYHPFLTSKYLADVFFFEKKTDSNQMENSNLLSTYLPPKEKSYPRSINTENGRRHGSVDRRDREHRTGDRLGDTNIKIESNIPLKQQKSFISKHTNLPVDCLEICKLLQEEEGLPNAKKMLYEVLSGSGEIPVSGSSLAAAVIFFLNIQDFDSADFVLSYMEKYNNESFSLFLRGEYNFLKGNAKEAANYFEQAAGKDGAFWPALYRIALLAADGNHIRYEYKIIKACESIELGKNNNYECFMGGFSPDYFHRILNRRVLDGKLT